ncbi:MAG: helix-turn-helix transcriptional regulator, partial [Bacteroidales bacterium]|nr:helix-turn-helix transcriptional regulator [Bacteroidales bacterium]
MSILSERLIEERTRLNISKAEMAKRLGITRPAYLYYENGKNKPPIQTLSRLAEMFDASTDYLLGKTDERKPSDLSPSATPAARPLTLEEKERAIKEWFTAI